MKENKYSKFSCLLPIGIVMLLPSFLVAFIHQGNMIDRTFFFVAVLGYLFIIIASVSSYKKQHIKK